MGECREILTLFEVERNETALKNKAKFIYEWYREWLKENKEPEADVIRAIDLSKPEGRFELIVLARLFNNNLKEEKAIKYFNIFKQYFLSKGFSYYIENRKVGMIDINVVKDTSHNIHKEFRNLVMSILPPKMRNANYNGFICCAHAFSQNDLIDYKNETDNKDLLNTIEEKLRKCGIFVKSFLIVREMYKAKVWNLNKEDLWMCCVPDSKVRGFLNDMGVIPKKYRIEKGQKEYDLSQLKEYSKMIWKFFNEPFEEKFFDLPIFRYLKEGQQNYIKNSNAKEIDSLFIEKHGQGILKNDKDFPLSAK